MRLLYWYTHFQGYPDHEREYRGLTHFELNMSSTDCFHFDPEKNELKCVPFDTPLLDGFWGRKIYNFNVLTGNNGAGKSTIMNYVMDTLNSLYNRSFSSYDMIVFVVEISGKKSAIVISKDNPIKIRIPNGLHIYQFNNESLPDRHPILDALDRAKIIYITNTLNEADDLRMRNSNYQSHVRHHFIYDCSVSGTMRINETDDTLANETHDLNQSYFFHEYYKQVKYVCDRKQYSHLIELRKNGIPVPVPNSLEIHIRDIVADQMVSRITDCYELLRVQRRRFSAAKATAFYLCAGCLFAFERNLVINWCPDLKPDWKYTLGSIDYDSFEKLFLTALQNAFPEDKNQLPEDVKSEPTARDEAKELCNRCLYFISFVLSDFDMISRWFKPSEYLLANVNLTGDYMVDMSLDTNTDYDWLLDFMRAYRRTSEPYYFLDFSWGLSSGEYNLLKMFSNFYYVYADSDDHISNIKEETGERIYTDTILVFMDEADLTYHPEWQRQFVSILTAFLPKVFGVRKIEDIQILLTSHSPLLLSDMPKNNVIYLQKGGNAAVPVDLDTFGQNIHQILKNNFFLSKGTVGAFAVEKINHTAMKLQDIARELREKQQGEKDDQYYLRIRKQLDKCSQLIDLVAPGVLKGKLIQMYREAKSLLPNTGNETVGENEYYKARKMSEDQLKAYLQLYQTELNRRNQND